MRSDTFLTPISRRTAIRMKAVAIEWEKNKVKEPVMPSPENVLAGTYNPLSRPLFIYVSRKSLDKPAVKEFVEFYLKNVEDSGDRGQVRASYRYCLPDGDGAPSHSADRNRLWWSSRSWLTGRRDSQADAKSIKK